jgi:hypothetical protein
VIRNLVGTVQLAALPTPPAVSNVQSGIRLPPQPPPSSTPAGRQLLPAGLERRILDIPPPTETRFIKNEVIRLGPTPNRFAWIFWLLGRVHGVVRHFSPSPPPLLSFPGLNSPCSAFEPAAAR